MGGAADHTIVSERSQPFSPFGAAGLKATVREGGVRSTTTVAVASPLVTGGRIPVESVSVARTRKT